MQLISAVAECKRLYLPEGTHSGIKKAPDGIYGPVLFVTQP